MNFFIPKAFSIIGAKIKKSDKFPNKWGRLAWPKI
jgi:hypothetical protein